MIMIWGCRCPSFGQERIREKRYFKPDKGRAYTVEVFNQLICHKSFWLIVENDAKNYNKVVNNWPYSFYLLQNDLAVLYKEQGDYDKSRITASESC